ncbi:MAG: thermonuclease family protein [Thermodesulfobacteriota bacterium]
MNALPQTMRNPPFAMPLLFSAFLIFTACSKYGKVADTLDFLKFESFNCDVVRVESGDSFFCLPPDMDMERIRLIGVSISQESENDAKKYCESILRRGTLVKIEPDKKPGGREDDIPAYVFVPGGKMLNVLLIDKGFATPAEKELNEKYKNLFTGAKKQEKPEKNETINQGEKPPWLR